MELDRAIDITAEQRTILLELLERHLPNTAAWVYGSRAKMDLTASVRPGFSSFCNAGAKRSGCRSQGSF